MFWSVSETKEVSITVNDTFYEDCINNDTIIPKPGDPNAPTKIPQKTAIPKTMEILESIYIYIYIIKQNW